ncbi:Hypothetical predicted protein [Marmota monax]|uniref:Uncharacterized protein n=1 Tax=Marmota monax TaxID=9995 RepID=A0A5E4AU53_MARMO|nr:hypothetical protein GHT09_013046 [Marmota monax]VTJ60685.1 Hypothetical predicted protein [Marmota monax]
MAEAAADVNGDVSEEAEDAEGLALDDSGIYQQVTNLLDIMDSESAKTDMAGAGLDMRKTLASVIITEKATAEPSMVICALTRCLKVPEVGPPRPAHLF